MKCYKSQMLEVFYPEINERYYYYGYCTNLGLMSFNKVCM